MRVNFKFYRETGPSETRTGRVLNVGKKRVVRSVGSCLRVGRGAARRVEGGGSREQGARSKFSNLKGRRP